MAGAFEAVVAKDHQSAFPVAGVDSHMFYEWHTRR